MATLACTAAALVLCWPMLTGQFLLGSDQYVAGYGFRLFGAEHFKAHGAIPQWNPYLFGGLPFIAAMHGDVFYPTAWLRWILPVDTAMNLGFAVHLVLAGLFMYAFLRALGVAWAAALAGGLAYELSGIVASLVNPGHDGKLFVSAMTPLVFLAVLRLVRDQQLGAAGILALAVGLSLHGHPQMSYYLLVAGALWGLYLVFLVPGKPTGRAALTTLGLGLLGVGLGFGMYAIQALPFIEYIPYSPRGDGGPSGGWEYATAFSMPIDELMSLVLPEFNGVLEAYWGDNFFKLHTEYVGVLPFLLAILGAGDRRHRSIILALGGIAVLFLLVSFGGHTPFYRLWYEVMPMMKKVRAPGMAFFLPAFVLAVLAGFGVDRVLRGEIAARRVLALTGGIAVVAVLGAMGVLQAIAEGLAAQQMFQQAQANASNLVWGSARLLAATMLSGGVLWFLVTRGPQSRAALLLLPVLIVADLALVARSFFPFQPPASITYRDDAITTRLRETPLPYRTLDLGVYRGSWLMAHDVPTLLGYHGNEIRFFDELLGGKNEWRNLGTPAFWELYAVRYLVAGQPIEAPEWRLVMGPVETTSGTPGYLYEAVAPTPWAQVIPGAAKAPEDQIIPTVIDPRFPVDRVVLYPDTASVTPIDLKGVVPEASAVTVSVAEWQPGAMRLTLAGEVAAGNTLLVSENWYPDWTASVDGIPVQPVRGQYALLTVPLPAGARTVELRFASSAYATGRWISLAALALALGLAVVGALQVRPGTSHG